MAIASKRMLVIDDEVDNVELLSEVGEIAGYATDGLTDPRRLDSMLDPTPDVIVLDLAMPGMDGIQVMRELAARRCPARLVLVTGQEYRMLSAAAHLGEQLGLDVAGQLQKPVSVAEMASLLRETPRPGKGVRGVIAVDGDEVRAALDDGSAVVVHYQPQISLADGRWIGVEGLVRWQHPRHGMIYPDAFVPLAEVSGLGAQLTRRVLERSVRDLKQLEASAGFVGTISINLPPSALGNVDFPDEIAAQLDAAGVPAQRIVLEVTEGSLASGLPVEIDILSRLRLKGIGLAIDDFGTGHSTLELLHRLPFSELKIDRSFVRVLDRDPAARAIIENSINLARQLGMATIAEGVESERQFDWLRRRDCNNVQGYLTGHPMPVDLFGNWAANWRETAPMLLAARPAPEGVEAEIGDTNFKVFLVDDEPMVRELLEAVVGRRYTVETFAGASACLARLSERLPDLIVTDIDMPEMDGLEFCRRLKEDFGTSGIPVLFLSGSNSIDARIATYDVGGEDMVVKPFKNEELLQKIDSIRRHLADRLQVREQAELAQRAAFTAMSSMSELGVVIGFLRESYGCRSGSEVAEAVLKAVEQYDLEGVVQIRVSGESYTLSREGENNPLEISVVEHARKQGRIFEFANRGVYNFDTITLMVKKRADLDPERCGRMRDNLAILAEGGDARLKAIEVEERNRRSQAGLGSALREIRTTLADLDAGLQRERRRTEQGMRELHEELAKSFVHLGLSELQEEFLVDLIQAQIQKTVADRAADRLTYERLQQLAQQLDILLRPG